MSRAAIVVRKTTIVVRKTTIVVCETAIVVCKTALVVCDTDCLMRKTVSTPCRVMCVPLFALNHARSAPCPAKCGLAGLFVLVLRLRLRSRRYECEDDGAARLAKRRL